jgi:hypothetical protein
MKTERQQRPPLVVNVLPQSDGAWTGIAAAVACLSFAWAINSMAGCQARSDEARYGAAEKAAATAVEVAKP